MMPLAKFILRQFLRLLYKVDVSGMEHYEQAGKRVLIVANHTSLLDGILLYAWLPETPTFAINTEVATNSAFKPLLKFVELFEMDPRNPLSVKSMIKYIRQDKKAVIFPEGRITITGLLMKIYEGPGLIADKSDAMILPVAIDGAQLSPFSYMQGRGHICWFPRISLRVLPPQKINLPADVLGHQRRKIAASKMQDLMNRLIYSNFNYRTTLYAALTATAKRYGRHQTCIEDFNREKLSYRDIILRSILLGGLIKKQTKADERIGVLLPNVNALPVLFFALQFIGRIPAMLNFSAGALAIQRACEAAQIKTVYTSQRFITGAKLEPLLDELKKHVQIIYLEDLKEQIKPADKIAALLKSRNPDRYLKRQKINMNPDAPAVILFTSGSEGVPKGVVLSHSNLLSNFSQVRCHINFNPTDTVFSCLPLFHSFGLNAGFLMPLFGGGKIFLYPTPLHYRIIPELIYELGATILFGTNTFFKGYARYAHPYDFNSLNYVVAGAEKLQQDTVDLYMNKFGIRILQGYGVTETSPVISVNDLMQNKAGTVGRLMTDMDYYIQPVEGIEEGGRLVVKGPNLMLGYLLHDEPGKIQPPSTERGANWYDTGDIAAVDDQGFFSILGRAKRFAKIGGEMVSLTAVEELAMLAWPGFGHAAIAVEDERKGEKIILVTECKRADRKAIQSTARLNHISELSVPKTIIKFDKLPVLGSGKTDYMSLTRLIGNGSFGGK